MKFIDALRQTDGGYDVVTVVREYEEVVRTHRTETWEALQTTTAMDWYEEELATIVGLEED